MIASMAYVVRTNINSLGREDRDEYLAERLSDGRIARNAFSYMGMLGLNTFLFNYAGLSTDTLIKNPTVQLADTVLKGAGKVGGALTDGDGEAAIIETGNLLGNLSPNHPFAKIPVNVLTK